MNILFETDKLRLETEQEYAYLVLKATGECLMEDDFYGNPTCGLIDVDNQWAIVAGEHLTIWTKTKIKKIDIKELQWIHSVRMANSSCIEVLVDPWSEKSAIWTLDPLTFKLSKLCDFDDYKNLEYSEIVIW